MVSKQGCVAPCRKDFSNLSKLYYLHLKGVKKSRILGKYKGYLMVWVGIWQLYHGLSRYLAVISSYESAIRGTTIASSPFLFLHRHDRYHNCDLNNIFELWPHLKYLLSIHYIFWLTKLAWVVWSIMVGIVVNWVALMWRFIC